VAGTLQETGERVLALVGSGGYAEYATAPRDRIFAIPTGSRTAPRWPADPGHDRVAFAALCGPAGRGRERRRALGGGGVGSLATQLARAFGAGRVIATASSPEKRALAMELGADIAVAGEAEGLTERLIEANGGRELDVVLDSSAVRSSTPPTGPWRRSGGSSSTESRPAKRTPSARARCCATPVRSSASTCSTASSAPGCSPRAERVVRPDGPRELRAIVGQTYPLEQARSTDRPARARTTGKLLLDRAPEHG